ncbi:hypothetical protein QMK17_24105 [Rhodococcus sp. G-MC3]|uniref:hypothetical protein n=1 Tax=Rhodococcus sp. G-MC3 TaxID=3046209 RepID=UPI0024BB2B0D|nr:hypothetical protein [Rhodococcus sp. G-MC3]MDJ0396394.1 hypothetical protein [Rhodococcus sp. G-MC3]
MLAAAGLSYRAIAALDRTDITIAEDESRWIGGSHRLRLTADNPAGFRPADVWRCWDTVLRFADRYPSATLVLDHLRSNAFRTCPGGRIGHARWRYRSTGGDTCRSRRSPVRQRPRGLNDDTHDAAPSVPEHDSVELDTGHCEVGIRARRTAHTLLTEVPGLYDGVENLIDALLARTLGLLAQHTGETDQPL